MCKRFSQLFKQRSWFFIVMILGVIITAVCLRIYKLGDQSLWQDEIFRTLIATYLSKSYGDIAALAAIQSQPPLSYWVTRVMFDIANLLGLAWSDFLARFPSMLIGAGTIPILYFTTRDCIGMKEARIATILIAISPLHIRYSQEVGPYALWPLVILIESYFLLRALLTRKIGYWMLTTLFMVLSVYAHSFSSIIIALQVVAVGMLFIGQILKKPEGQRWVIFQDVLFTGLSGAGAALSFLPLLSELLSGSSKYMVGLKMPLWDYLAKIMNSFSPVFISKSLPGAIVPIGVLMLGILVLIRSHLIEGSILTASVIGTALVEYVLFVKTGWQYFYPRYIIGILPLYFIVWSVGLIWIAEKLAAWLLKPVGRRNSVASTALLFGLTLLVVVGSVRALPATYRAKKQDWRGLTQYLVENLGAHDAVIFSPRYYQDYYHYYFPEELGTNERFESQVDGRRFENLYLVADEGTDITGIAGEYGDFENVQVFPGGVALWKLKIGLLLNTLPLLNQDFSVVTGKGQTIPSLVGWSVVDDGYLKVTESTDSSNGNLVEFRFDRGSDRVAMTSPYFSIPQERLVVVDAMVSAENIGAMGANLMLEIRDSKGLLLDIFESDAIKNTQGWVRLVAGGITPENAFHARIVLKLFNPPRETGIIWCRDVHVYGDWQSQQTADPLRKIEIPNAEFTMLTDNNKIAWWNIPSSDDVVVALEKNGNSGNGNSLWLITTGPGADYMVRSPTLPMDAMPGNQFVFLAHVKTENLSGPKGMEIAVGWVGEGGKIFMWSESARLMGTNDWQIVNIVGEIPKGADGIVLIPLRLFDSVSEGEYIWIDQVELYIQGQILFNNQLDAESENELIEVNIPNADFKVVLATGLPDWWKIPQNNLIQITLDPAQALSGHASLWAVTNGSGADYMMRSPEIFIECDAGNEFLFQVDVKTKGLSGPKGMEIAIGWFGKDGRVFQWSESQRIVGTNNWQVLEVRGQIPNDAEGLILVPLRIFDSANAGEMVWINKISLWFTPGVRILNP